MTEASKTRGLHKFLLTIFAFSILLNGWSLFIYFRSPELTGLIKDIETASQAGYEQPFFVDLDNEDDKILTSQELEQIRNHLDNQAKKLRFADDFPKIRP